MPVSVILINTVKDLPPSPTHKLLPQPFKGLNVKVMWYLLYFIFNYIRFVKMKIRNTPILATFTEQQVQGGG
jgi:hypothetical protein